MTASIDGYILPPGRVRVKLKRDFKTKNLKESLKKMFRFDFSSMWNFQKTKKDYRRSLLTTEHILFQRLRIMTLHAHFQDAVY